MAIVELPIVYSIRGVPPRKRAVQTFWVMELAPFELREAPASDLIQTKIDEAPVTPLSVWPLHVHDRRVVDVVRFDRELETPIAAIAERIDNLRRWSGDFRNYPVSLAAGDAKATLQKREAIDLRTIEYDGRRDAIAAAAERLNDSVLVDGRLWSPANEPVWAVIPHEDRIQVRLASVHAELGISHYRIDRLQDAYAFAELLAGEKGCLVEGPAAVPTMDGIDWRCDAFGVTLRRAAQRAIDSCVNDKLLEMPDSFYAAFVKLRSLKRLGEDLNSDHAEEFREAASAMLESLAEDESLDRLVMVQRLKLILERVVWRIENQERSPASTDDEALESAIAHGT